MSHAMVRCRVCDLAYVDRAPSQATLAASYHEADYDSADEAEDAADAYARAIAPVLETLKGRGAALEIGTGTGAFLERLQKAGFQELVGVEPSPAAIAAAPAHRKPWIREGIFVEQDFAPGSFDLICCFMTLEHVRDPGALVASARRLLKPGGVFVSVTHDRRAWLNRLLGCRSPIVDIEHMQLFSDESAKGLLARNGYVEVGGASFRNAYSPSYWLRLVPMPDRLKSNLTAALRGTWLDRRKLAANVGNFMSWGFRPH
ncbi:class I SAM-dependent methyltransferase [Sphingomonas sp. CGMCC 1.13654]|uniref:Class I SAM-dependent methyltransferase n=2 Tax=Sphingomonas chungangi TaxID=2683589 RepID=A0A838LC12_9SPHN|nr:class I SAM-dependent methyltransferase [Sphingomonas chungangi]MVW55545.1 methyltransferase domain-containing protein [Sphingomonas chungangi]